MQQKILNLMEELPAGLPVPTDIHLSFKPFLDHIRYRLQNGESIKKEIFELILQKFDAHPELEGNIEVEKLQNYKPLLDLLYITLSNIIEDETKVYWGLCIPMSAVMFYGSDPFYEMLGEANQQNCSLAPDHTEIETFIKNKTAHFYSFILERFYNISYSGPGNFVRSMVDPETGIRKHFRLNLNTDFVEVTCNRDLPEIGLEKLRENIADEYAFTRLQDTLPPEIFSFSGFTIMTLTDVTAEFALNTIRETIVTNKVETSFAGVFPEVQQSLRELLGSNEINFNILPIFNVNGKPIEDIDVFSHSVLLSGLKEKNNGVEKCLALINNFIENPRLIFFAHLDKDHPSQKEIDEVLQQEGVQSYVLYPVFYNNKMIGALEIYSRQKDIIDEKRLSLLEPAKQMLAQLVQNSISAFNEEIEKVIKEKFTNLQPSVQWKFNEAAWHYLSQKKQKKKNVEPEEIIFDGVFPLYGAVDVKNSTIERNAALFKDLKIQFTVLISVLKKLRAHSGFGLLDEKIYTAQNWADTIEAGSSVFNQQVKLNDFLENDIMSFLQQFTYDDPRLQAITGEYFAAVNEKDGAAFANRRHLESSMETVISAVNNYFQYFKEEIQQAYPSYFEKFRTDGVEYDIYIGQSITADKAYNNIYLKNLRLMQLQSMAAITKLTHELLPSLSTKVETTQLIFIHSQSIDIRFRRDEKRFDVEGAYNIRYHIIKKRIDKVTLKSSRERLTQPGKIALVYFNQKEADEYIGYIKFLQGQNILLNDLEELELEELQGVAGLKAMRIGVVL